LEKKLAYLLEKSEKTNKKSRIWSMG